MSAPMFGVVDDDEPDDDTAGSDTVLDFIRRTIADNEKAAARTVSLRPVSRPELELVCEVPTNADVIAKLSTQAEKAAAAPNAPAEGVIMNCKMLAKFTRTLRVNGVDAPGSGQGSVFAGKQMLAATGAPNAWRAVRQLFKAPGGDYDDITINHLADELMTASGIRSKSAVAVGEDPT